MLFVLKLKEDSTVEIYCHHELKCLLELQVCSFLEPFISDVLFIGRVFSLETVFEFCLDDCDQVNAILECNLENSLGFDKLSAFDQKG